MLVTKVLAICVLLASLLCGCTGQIGRTPRSDSPNLWGDELVAAPGGDVINVKVGLGIVGVLALIGTAKWLFHNRPNRRDAALAVLMSRAVEDSPEDRSVREAIEKSARDTGMKKALKKLRRRASTEPKK